MVSESDLPCGFDVEEKSRLKEPLINRIRNPKDEIDIGNELWPIKESAFKAFSFLDGNDPVVWNWADIYIYREDAKVPKSPSLYRAVVDPSKSPHFEKKTAKSIVFESQELFWGVTIVSP